MPYARCVGLPPPQKLLDAGNNVVLLANHQTEADPGIFAHMTASLHPKMATDVIYVAGDRVVTDALCKPFSMGRNLFCVHRQELTLQISIQVLPSSAAGSCCSAFPNACTAC